MTERHQIVEDMDFWLRLEYEACGWLERSNESRLRRFYIDGFYPERIANTKYGADILGMAWVGYDQTQKLFQFAASVPQKMLYRSSRRFLVEEVIVDEVNKTVMIRIAVEKAAGRA